MFFEIYMIVFSFDLSYLIYFYWQVFLFVKGVLLEDLRLIEDVEEEKKNFMGLMYIIVLCLVDIFFDDLNFCNLVMDQFVCEIFINIICYSVEFDYDILVFVVVICQLV